MRGRDRQPDGICVPCSTALFDRAAVKWQARLALERPALRLPDIRGISGRHDRFRGTAAELFVATKTEFEK
jgi:hypothetical protein